MEKPIKIQTIIPKNYNYTSFWRKITIIPWHVTRPARRAHMSDNFEWNRKNRSAYDAFQIRNSLQNRSHAERALKKRTLCLFFFQIPIFFSNHCHGWMFCIASLEIRNLNIIWLVILRWVTSYAWITVNDMSWQYLVAFNKILFIWYLCLYAMNHQASGTLSRYQMILSKYLIDIITMTYNGKINMY